MGKDLETDIFRIVNENSDNYHMGEYIITRFNLNMDIENAKRLAALIVKETGYTKSEVFSGKADSVIFSYLKLNSIKEKSVAKKGEKRVETPVKTVKKNVLKKIITYILVGTISVSALSAWLVPQISEMKEDKEITQTLGMLASNSDEYVGSIVSQNTYRVGLDSSGYPVIAYHNDRIAQDIIKICTQDPELFDLCMHNVYFDMNHNRLGNMDSVVRYLKIFTEGDESLAVIYDKLQDCSVFLDYLVNRGFIDPNDPEYYTVLEDIEQYKTLTSKTEVPFEALPIESQKRIENLIDNYRNNQDNLYAEYKDNLEELDGEDFGSR